VAEDARAAAVLEQQRREQPDQRRLPRAVLAEDGHRLAARDLERHAVERRDALPAPAQAFTPVVAEELLAEVVDDDGGRSVGVGRTGHAMSPTVLKQARTGLSGGPRAVEAAQPTGNISTHPP
jgi:hypothetical protein